jgi:hypothetical protein
MEAVLRNEAATQGSREKSNIANPAKRGELIVNISLDIHLMLS